MDLQADSRKFTRKMGQKLAQTLAQRLVQKLDLFNFLRATKACLCLLLCTVTSGAVHAQDNTASSVVNKCPIIPQPANASLSKEGEVFVLDRSVKFLAVNDQDAAVTDMQAYFKKRLEALTGSSWSSLNKGKGHRQIILKRLPSDLLTSKNDKNSGVDPKKMQATAGYQLQISPDKILIESKSDAGLYYGLNSLLQLAVQPTSGAAGSTAAKAGQIKIDCWQIKDQPALAWRGFMLDESRHFFGKQKVKMLLDWMAFYKLNYFHWHLTDAPAWRMTIHKYPLLTSIGSIGNKTDSTAPAKFYTQEEIREIVAYAKKRYINVIAEIDMPGHATAANRAYPMMSGGGTGQYANFTFNPGLDTTYGFLTNILEETATLFPSHLLHIGGDEVAFGSKSWLGQPAVQKLMQTHDLKDIKAVEYYFLRRMADSALKFNNKVLAWDEAVDAGLPADKTIIYWWRHDRPVQLQNALKAGSEVVLCPRIPLYFDFIQDSSYHVGRIWKGHIFAALKQVFDFWPGDYKVITNQNMHQVLGIQANLWTETVLTKKRLDFMVFPRIAALATAGWTAPDRRQYPAFLDHLKAQLPLYKRADIYYYDPFATVTTPEVTE